VVPSTPFVLDRERLEALDAWHVSPTDLWLVAAAADAVETGDPAVDAFGGSGDGLDTRMDALATTIDDATGDVMTRAVERLTAERDAARRALAGVSDELLRTRAEIADRLDALAAENATLHERLRRRDLAAELGDP
ncbi:MAG: hypothetical protein HKN41_01605, partial [Ilumatobacter sp.]|nr:hypothetical protein [Ilumatobacter sp.]